MDILLIIGIILLLILNGLFIALFVIGYRFLQELRFLLSLLQTEADKVTVDLQNIRSRLRSRGPWLGLLLGLIGRRGTLKKLADGVSRWR